MTAQSGKDLLVKIGDGASPENFTSVCGLRTTTLAFNATNIDVTNSDSTDMWRELLAEGVKSAKISGSGVFKDAASDVSLRTAFFRSDADRFPDRDSEFRHGARPVQDLALQYDGPYDGEVKITLTLDSAGALTFTST